MEYGYTQEGVKVYIEDNSYPRSSGDGLMTGLEKMCEILNNQKDNGRNRRDNMSEYTVTPRGGNRNVLHLPIDIDFLFDGAGRFIGVENLSQD